MTKILFILSLTFTFATAAPLELEGGALYVETIDTTLTFNAPDDGMVFVGYTIQGDGMGWGFHFIMNHDTLFKAPMGGEGLKSVEHAFTSTISKGEHVFFLTKPYGSEATITTSRIWVLFWPKKTVAVAELGEGAGIPPVAFLASLCRAGTPVQVSLPSSAVYDASGKLVERPEGEWIPASTGTYFIKSEKQTHKVVVVK